MENKEKEKELNPEQMEEANGGLWMPKPQVHCPHCKCYFENQVVLDAHIREEHTVQTFSRF